MHPNPAPIRLFIEDVAQQKIRERREWTLLHDGRGRRRQNIIHVAPLSLERGAVGQIARAVGGQVQIVQRRIGAHQDAAGKHRPGREKVVDIKRADAVWRDVPLDEQQHRLARGRMERQRCRSGLVRRVVQRNGCLP